jgi:hypothetical protein
MVGVISALLSQGQLQANPIAGEKRTTRIHQTSSKNERLPSEAAPCSFFVTLDNTRPAVTSRAPSEIDARSCALTFF